MSDGPLLPYAIQSFRAVCLRVSFAGNHCVGGHSSPRSRCMGREDSWFTKLVGSRGHERPVIVPCVYLRLGRAQREGYWAGGSLPSSPNPGTAMSATDTVPRCGLL